MRDDVLEAVRAHAQDYQLFITDRGSVTTIQVASQLVDLFRDRLRAQVGTPLTDAALHDFLDRVFASEPSPPPKPSADPDSCPSAESPTASPRTSPSLWQRITGGLTMVVRNIDRPAAIVAIGTALAAGAIGWRAGRDGTERITQPPQYAAPTTWSHLPPAEEQTYLNIDQALWQFESMEDLSGATTLAMSIFALGGQDVAKRKWATVIADSSRHYLLGPILTAMDPAQSHDNTRLTVLICAERLILDGGSGIVSHQDLKTLEGLAKPSVERNEAVLRLAERILASL